MSKISVIISREFLSRVRKRSFIVSTLLMPIIIVVIILLPVYIANHVEKESKIFVLDDNDYFINKFHNTAKLKFEYPSGELDNLQQRCIAGECDAVLHILGGSQGNRANLFFFEDPPLSLKGDIAEQMDEIMFDRTLQQEFQLDIQRYKSIKELSHSDIQTLQIDEAGQAETRMVELNRIAGIVCGALIYMFVFMYANQVMRSVIEEKSNRIMEVIVSSVKPFQFMMGKIVGVALVGLTQFAMQIAFVALLLFAVQLFAPQTMMGGPAPTEVSATAGTAFDGAAVASNDADLFADISAFYSFPFSTLLICFFIYFLIGYLIYASLYAGVGSATDNETDSNQLVLPISLPLVFTLIAITIGLSPQHELIRWLSFIPFTSPMAMLYRIPSGVPLWELFVSIGLLVATFFACVWFAAKIYRVGLLTYGRKVGWRELFRWLRL